MISEYQLFKRPSSETYSCLSFCLNEKMEYLYISNLTSFKNLRMILYRYKIDRYLLSNTIVICPLVQWIPRIACNRKKV